MYGPTGDWNQGRCKQNDEAICLRGGYCGFIHFKPEPRFARAYLKKMRNKSK